VAFVQGFERNPQDPTHLQASACCKHYAANSMEDTTEGGVKLSRHTIDANITQQDLIDSYLAPFQACVEQVRATVCTAGTCHSRRSEGRCVHVKLFWQGKVSGLMCSYNAINGKPTCADPWLLQDVARDAWGFDGYITSDW
jgi:beta-glucosidase-like glycosyl hydrolase